LKPVQNILLTVDAIVFSHKDQLLQVLLIQRKHDPDQGLWAFPGGFVEDGEELDVAASRELEEETGLKVPKMQQLHTFGKVGRDPRGRTVSVVYYTFLAESGQHVAGADDAADAQWINVKDITGLAFDHKEILDYAVQQLKNELTWLVV
jgi:8-oxo-dGTP diphosphatase